MVGGRVLVPFRKLRMSGRGHRAARSRAVESRPRTSQILDAAPVLDAELMRLGEWICRLLSGSARRSLPHHAAAGRGIESAAGLPHHRSRMDGAAPESAERDRRGGPRRTPKSRCSSTACSTTWPRETARANRLCAPHLRAGRELLAGMVRKRWITAEDVSSARDDPRGSSRVVQLKEVRRQAQCESAEDRGDSGCGRRQGRGRSISAASRCRTTTLATLAKRGIVEILKEPAEFAVSRLKASPVSFFQLNPAQAGGARSRFCKRVE